MDQGQRGREHRTPLWAPGSVGCPTQHHWAVPHITTAGGYQGDLHMAQAPPAGGSGHGASPAGAESPHDLQGQLSEGIRGLPSRSLALGHLVKGESVVSAAPCGPVAGWCPSPPAPIAARPGALMGPRSHPSIPSRWTSACRHGGGGWERAQG